MIDDAGANEMPLTATALKASGGGVPMEKIIVAIHGVGNQLRSSTIRSVARRFGDRSTPPLPVMPLGYFSSAAGSNVRWSRLDAKPDDVLAKIGFAEVYWADIPAQVVKANDTLEETKAWGRTVVSRAESVYEKSVPNGNLTPQDFALGIGVVEELIETIDVLENLLWVTAKAGVFKFEIGELLRDYVDDVQIVTDFPVYREKILYRLHSALAAIVATYQETYPGRVPDIYLVAHSEGTVISLLGLLQALSNQVIPDHEDPAKSVDTSWVTFVRGFMTIGSPIDKHITLWPKLWDDFNMTSSTDESGAVVLTTGNQTPVRLPRKIKWRNYFDYGDPIGFKLESAVDLLQDKGCAAFEFATAEHDFGFSRYPMPGKAHNDYWDDADVFGHFIEDVVIGSGQAQPPANRRFASVISKCIPYFATFLLHLIAVFVLYKAVTATSDTIFTAEIVLSAGAIGLLGVLLTCITVAARIPRLVKPNGARWEIVSMIFLLIGALCVAYLPTDVATFLGERLPSLPFTLYPGDESAAKTALMTAAVFVVVIAGWVVPRRPKLSRRALLGSGACVIAYIIGARLFFDDSIDALPIWPVILAGLMFLYLWWLAIMLFDLTFVWHRYVREAVFVQALRCWRRREDAKPRPMMGLGPEPPPVGSPV
ncbi:MFS transporter [Massilia niabensis]|uniref:MFS transporter n=1 Tax=Massilia niabensis TaxID=544910 RepID=A0ABW0L8W5_9BURK